MGLPLGLDFGLGSLPLLSSALTRSISAENPDGAKGGGAHAVPGPEHAGARMGEGWKARECIVLEPGETATLADIEGSGIIQHIWITPGVEAYRSCVLRMYWDDEETPSVEAPLGDWFANVHARQYAVNSLPVAVNPTGGLNSYWPMPFRRRARITVQNDYWQQIPWFYYQITYALTDVPEEAGTLHAQWRRSLTSYEQPEHVILEDVRGEGQYVGTVLGWSQFSNMWWGEGEVKFYMDGDGRYPTICGTGTEDYFGGAWGFKQTFSTPYLGYPFWRKEPGEVPQHGLYRWHILDPIRFQSDLKVTVQALGWVWLNEKLGPLADDVCSLAYWYQREPHAPFPQMPDLTGRWPR
ncbi:MAG: glycoside hydrolase family 172 protein [Anaerolineae bacterium]